MKNKETVFLKNVYNQETKEHAFVVWFCSHHHQYNYIIKVKFDKNEI